MRRRLVGHDVGRHASSRELGQYVGRVAFEGDGSRHARLLPLVDAIERVVEVRRPLVDVSGRQAPLDAGRVDLDHERDAAVHRHGKRLRAAHATEAGGHDKPTGQRAAEMAPRQLGQCFIRPLQNALGADVDPAAGRHLAVHGEPAIFEIAEMRPRRPGRNEQGIGDEHARRPRVRAEDGDGFPRLHHERLVVLEAEQRRDDGVERRPAARRAPGSAVDDEIIGTFGDFRIEVVHQHSERSFLRPSFAGDRRASRRADMAAEGAHRADMCGRCCPSQSLHAIRIARAEGSNLRTYASVVNLKLKNFLLDFCSDWVEQRSVRNPSGDRIDVGRRRPVDGEHGERSRARARARAPAAATCAAGRAGRSPGTRTESRRRRRGAPGRAPVQP